jgi:hypothetical protein
MKKMILISAAILLSFASFAQTHSTDNMMKNNKMGNGMNHQAMYKSHGDRVMMLNGKMMMEHSGKMTLMHRNMTMSNGTRVMTNGTCIKKDGLKMMMKDGQQMDMSGKMMAMKDPNMKK